MGNKLIEEYKKEKRELPTKTLKLQILMLLLV
jgi:hypothetical protein